MSVKRSTQHRTPEAPASIVRYVRCDHCREWVPLYKDKVSGALFVVLNGCPGLGS